MNKDERTVSVAIRKTVFKMSDDAAESAVFSTIVNALASGQVVMLVDFGSISAQSRPAASGAISALTRALSSTPRPSVRSRSERPIATL